MCEACVHACMLPVSCTRVDGPLLPPVGDKPAFVCSAEQKQKQADNFVARPTARLRACACTLTAPSLCVLLASAVACSVCCASLVCLLPFQELQPPRLSVRGGSADGGGAGGGGARSVRCSAAHCGVRLAPSP
jgi:hypothetical protein